MTRSELVSELAEHFRHLMLQDAERAVETIVQTMVLALTSGQRIEIRGVGSFGLKHRTGRLGRNPKSGQKVAIPQKALPFFKAGCILQARVNKEALN